MVFFGFLRVFRENNQFLGFFVKIAKKGCFWPKKGRF